MKKSLIALFIAGAFAAPSYAQTAAPEAAPAAEPAIHTLTANVGVVSDYVFRGISQTQHQAALQGGVDYAHVSGLYVGVWGSTLEWADRKDLQIQKGNHVELDLYGGYKNTIGDFGYDVGAIRYFYPGDFQSGAGVTANTTEAYIAGSWKFISLKYNHVLSNSIFNWGGTTSSTKSQGSGYTDLTVTYPIDETINLIGHVGRQNIKNDQNNSGDWSYTDWKLGATKDFGFGVLGVAYTDTNAKYNSGAPGVNYNWAGKDVGKAVFAVSFSKTF
jgi:uncharacterized protein (TIGR02001 family)